ncbi:S1 family peptidase [Paenibacillus sp. GCM10023252]|uniref:S1 family peptidase n=1 Tax=Paenibacillus sp. GCM10023252 TaxID=3252649 RepID=UPI00360A9B8A
MQPRKALLMGLTSTLVLGSLYLPGQKTSANEDVNTRVENFQAQVTPVIDQEVMKVFKTNRTVNNGTKELQIEVPDYAALNDQATFYIDNENEQVVFLVSNDNLKEIKELKKELSDKLGTKIKFKEAKHAFKDLASINDAVFRQLKDKQNVSTGINTANEVINIRADLSTEEKDQLVNTYGDVFNFMPAEPLVNPQYAVDYPFKTLSAGIKILPDTSATEKSSPSSGTYKTTSYCTSGLMGTKSSQAFMVTAGHCVLFPHSNASTTGGSGYADGGLDSNSNGKLDSNEYNWIGWQHYSQALQDGKDKDIGLIKLTNTSLALNAQWYSHAQADTVSKIKAYATPQVGTQIAKVGATTGFKIGTIAEVNYNYNMRLYTDFTTSNNVIVSVTGGIRVSGTDFSTVGDSGGIVFRTTDNAAIGLISGGSGSTYACAAFYNTLPTLGIAQYVYDYDTPLSNLQG